MDSREWRGRWRRRRWRSERARQRGSPPRRLRRRGADAGPAGGAEARLEHRPKLEARLGLPRSAMRGRSRQARSPGASRRRGHPALHEAGVSAEGPDLPAGRGPPLAARLGPGVGETRRHARADYSPPGTRSACSRSCRRGYGTQAEHLTPLQGRGRLRNLNDHGAFAATARHRISLVMKGSPVRVRASALRQEAWPAHSPPGRATSGFPSSSISAVRSTVRWVPARSRERHRRGACWPARVRRSASAAPRCRPRHVSIAQAFEDERT